MLKPASVAGVGPSSWAQIMKHSSHCHVNCLQVLEKNSFVKIRDRSSGIALAGEEFFEKSSVRYLFSNCRWLNPAQANELAILRAGYT